MLLEHPNWCGARDIEKFETAVASSTEKLIRVGLVKADIILSIRGRPLSKQTHVCFICLHINYSRSHYLKKGDRACANDPEILSLGEG
jgi:hypothetical protein